VCVPTCHHNAKNKQIFCLAKSHDFGRGFFIAAQFCRLEWPFLPSRMPDMLPHSFQALIFSDKNATIFRAASQQQHGYIVKSIDRSRIQRHTHQLYKIN
jgi:hypothetical protein